MKLITAFIFILTLSACDFSCASKTESSSTGVPAENVPKFNADYAFNQILAYEKLGPKVPGTSEHAKAGDWIVAELKKLNLEVREQKAEGVTFLGNKIPIRNIIASYKPTLTKRILLSAHWDNRPFADEDTQNKNKPILGVNDGGSGVVVLMGIAKALSEHTGKAPQYGVDFAFWDAEDWGMPSNAKSYCLGSQHWAAHPEPANYQAKFGINYDMVGRIGSVFPVDVYSLRKAPEVIRSLKAAAQKLGYLDFFPDYQIGPIVDDHYFVSEGRNIPMVDLIYMTEAGGFPPEWHTHQDTSEFISRDVLKVVAQTTLQLIFDSE